MRHHATYATTNKNTYSARTTIRCSCGWTDDTGYWIGAEEVFRRHVEAAADACASCGRHLDTESHADGCPNARYCPACAAQFDTDTEQIEHRCGGEALPRCAEPGCPEQASWLVPALALTFCPRHVEAYKHLACFRLIRADPTGVLTRLIGALDALIALDAARPVDWSTEDPDGHEAAAAEDELHAERDAKPNAWTGWLDG